MMLFLDCWFKRMTQPWLIIIYWMMIGFLYFYLDPLISYFISTRSLGHFALFLNAISTLCKPKILLGSILLLTLIFRYVFQQRLLALKAGFVWLCTLIPSLITLALKIIFGRARPELLLEKGIYGFQWFQHSRPFWSFPSGHTTAIMGCVFGLCIIYPRYRWYFLVIGFMVMASRVLLLQHYLSDVLVAAYLALIEVWMLQWLLKRYVPMYMKEVRS